MSESQEIIKQVNSVTYKQIAVFALSIVAAYSSGDYFIGNNNKSDSSTSLEYNDLDDRIRQLEHDVTECRAKQTRRDNNIKEGQRRFNILWDVVHTHQARVNEKHNSQDRLITECMRSRP